MLPLLCAAAGAVLAGARSLITIGEWIDDAPQSVLGLLGFPADPLTGVRPTPHAATVRRLLQRLAGNALDAAIISIFRQNGDTDIAAALRHTGRDHQRPLITLGLT